MTLSVVEGDLLDQPTEAIVNAWNRNIIPWWLLIPQGVSGAIKRRGGLAPFREVARFGPIALGGAVHTSAGRLGYKCIIHVAGINLLWRASEFSIRESVRNAMALAHTLKIRSIAFPFIGAGSGGLNEAKAEGVMRDAFARIDSSVDVLLVRFRSKESLPDRLFRKEKRLESRSGKPA
jgi:O-acetyl-ADP-ribose deacetylase